MLKNKLTSAPVLITPDYEKPFILQCDASGAGVGAVLAQVSADGTEMPIAFFSKKLNKAQANYCVTELECLAVVLALKKFRPYIEGQEFTIVTDHASLQWLMRQQDLSGKLSRWALKIQGYKFNIVHRRGKENIVPDTLSRKEYEENSPKETCKENIAEIFKIETLPLVNLQSEEFDSTEYVKLRTEILNRANEFPDLNVIGNKIYKRVEFSDGCPAREMFTWKLWIPKNLVNKTLQNAHNPTNRAHGGIGKTIQLLRTNLYWPKMVMDVKNFVLKCEVCQKNKASNVPMRYPMNNQYVATRPFQRLYMEYR